GSTLALIDIPIGLRSRHADERVCDRDARAVLGPRRSSVFPAPSRCALEGKTYAEACAKNRECTGRGLSRQTFHILPRIREVDAFLRRATLPVKLREMHPEVCFRALNHGKPMRWNKRTRAGFEERLAVLQRHHSQSGKLVDVAQAEYRRAELGRDDIVDALVGAITASHATDLSTFPPVPETDETGLPMEIVYWSPGQ
ncbi:MAG TPA: DUF429 domain-containing protein, partial [Chromatiales bacterium]|nr:DUF429 domain-containing protein [Chromatiales bacterium]